MEVQRGHRAPSVPLSSTGRFGAGGKVPDVGWKSINGTSTQLVLVVHSQRKVGSNRGGMPLGPHPEAVCLKHPCLRAARCHNQAPSEAPVLTYVSPVP